MTTDSQSDHIALLTRSRDTLMHHVPTASADRQLIAELDAAIVRIGERSLPWTITLYLAHITYSHGLGTMAVPSYKVLTTEIARFCRRQWNEISDDRDPATIADPTTVREYFQRHPEDRLHTCTIPVTPGSVTDIDAFKTGNYLTLSMYHLPWATRMKIDKWLEVDPFDRPVEIAVTRYGWFVAAEVVARHNCPTLPDELLAVLRAGYDRGCSYVLLHRDGPLLASLPTFES